jgi:hypothetical protein
MRNQSKPHTCKPQHRTRVVLDDAEIQRRMTRPARPTLAERYAAATDPAQRERLYANATDPAYQQRATAEANRRNALPPLPRHKAESTVWVTQPILRIRRWTDAAIRDFLPAPERRKPNPHLSSGRLMPLWSAATVARVEATAEWQDWLDASLRRRGLTLHDLAASAKGRCFRERIRNAATAIAAHQRADADRRRRSA